MSLQSTGKSAEAHKLTVCHLQSKRGRHGKKHGCRSQVTLVDLAKTRGCQPICKSAVGHVEAKGEQCALVTGHGQVSQCGSRITAYKVTCILTPGTVDMLGYMARRTKVADAIKVVNWLTLK